MKKRVSIIAEAGVNHNGSLALAKELVDAAAEAGADLVKFQTFSAERLVTRSATKAEYQKRTTNSKQSQLEMLKELELTNKMHLALMSHCKNREIKFFSAGFDLLSLEYLFSLGVELFKVPSGEITNLPYLRLVGALGRPVILSTGMSNLDEIKAALGVLEDAGMLREQITVLHCNTEYPTPLYDVNLRAMQSIRDELGVSIGYSDHTQGIEVPIAAVALGASVIEKHLTTDRKLPGPDHKASLEPHEFKAMVSAIRNIERAMGDGIKRPSRSEVKNKITVRKSLVASKQIYTGEVFSPDNVTTKRPGTGVSPMRWDEVMGRLADRNFAEDELLEFFEDEH